MRSVGLAAVVALAYFLAGRAALLLAIPPGYATAIWPAAGIALAAAVVCGPRVLPGVLVGSLAVNLSSSFDPAAPAAMWGEAGIAAVIAVGATAQAGLGALLFRALCTYPGTLDEDRDPIAFAAIVAPVSCLINPTVGVLALVQTGVLPEADAAFNWATWWVGDAIGVLIATPLTLVAIGEPAAPWRRRALPVALPLSLVMAVAVAAYVAVSAVEQDRIVQEYRSEVQPLAADLEHRRSAARETLESIRGLFEATGDVSEPTFLHFTARLLAANPSIQALGWNPVVTASEREAHEAAARARGHTDYRIIERDITGQLVAAPSRDRHIAVTYIQPLEGNEAALGYDILSSTGGARRSSTPRGPGRRRPRMRSPWSRARPPGGASFWSPP